MRIEIGEFNINVNREFINISAVIAGLPMSLSFTGKSKETQTPTWRFEYGSISTKFEIKEKIHASNQI